MRCFRFFLSCSGLILFTFGSSSPCLVYAQEGMDDPATSPEADLLVGSIWMPAGNLNYRDHLKVDKQVQELAALPFTELVIQVVYNGRAYYPSTLIPPVFGVSGEVDPLKRFISALRSAAPYLKIIAWVSPLSIGSATGLIPHPPGHVGREHPEWLNRRQDNQTEDADGAQYLEPSLPEVKTYAAELVEELVSTYDFDGLNIDSVCDPGEAGQWGYHPSAIQSWKKSVNLKSIPDSDDTSWIVFRNKAYTQFLSMVMDTARQANSEILLSAGVRANSLPPADLDAFSRTAVYLEYHQDWIDWMKRRLVDRIYLKNFRSEDMEKELFNQWASMALLGGERNNVEVFIGIGGYLNPAVDALTQLRRAAAMRPTGIALWNYERPVLDVGSRDLFMDTVHRTVLSPEYLRRLAQARGSLRITQAYSGAVTRTVQPVFRPEAVNEQAAPEINDRLLPEPPPIHVEPATGELIYIDPIPRGEVKYQADSMDRTDKPVDPNAITGVEYILPSRDEMIGELLKDSRFRESNPWAMIRPDELAKQYLRENFSNIF